MTLLQLAFGILLAGLIASGTAATLFELAARAELRFRKPFVSREHPARSFFVTALAGPFMLGNDALEAHRGGVISTAALGCCGAAAALWAFAWGAVVLALAERVAASLA